MDQAAGRRLGSHITNGQRHQRYNDSPTALGEATHLTATVTGGSFVDEWVNRITDDLLDVPHLHVTLTIDDLLWLSFHADRSLLKMLLKTAAQAVRELVEEL